MSFVDKINEEFNNESVKGRAPKLTGIALKKRKAKSEVMSMLNKDDTFKAAKEKLMTIAGRIAKKIAKENGIKPTLVDLDKIIIREGFENELIDSIFEGIDSYFATGKYTNGDEFHLDGDDLGELKDEVADYGKELDQKSIKYFSRDDDGKEKEVK